MDKTILKEDVLPLRRKASACVVCPAGKGIRFSFWNFSVLVLLVVRFDIKISLPISVKGPFEHLLFYCKDNLWKEILSEDSCASSTLLPELYFTGIRNKLKFCSCVVIYFFSSIENVFSEEQCIVSKEESVSLMGFWVWVWFGLGWGFLGFVFCLFVGF